MKRRVEHYPDGRSLFQTQYQLEYRRPNVFARRILAVFPNGRRYVVLTPELASEILDSRRPISSEAG